MDCPVRSGRVEGAARVVVRPAWTRPPRRRASDEMMRSVSSAQSVIRRVSRRVTAVRTALAERCRISSITLTCRYVYSPPCGTPGQADPTAATCPRSAIAASMNAAGTCPGPAAGSTRGGCVLSSAWCSAAATAICHDRSLVAGWPFHDRSGGSRALARGATANAAWSSRILARRWTSGGAGPSHTGRLIRPFVLSLQVRATIRSARCTQPSCAHAGSACHLRRCWRCTSTPSGATTCRLCVSWAARWPAWERKSPGMQKRPVGAMPGPNEPADGLAVSAPGKPFSLPAFPVARRQPGGAGAPHDRVIATVYPAETAGKRSRS